VDPGQASGHSQTTYVTTGCWIGPIAGNMQPPGQAARGAGVNKNADRTVDAKLSDGWGWADEVAGTRLGLFKTGLFNVSSASDVDGNAE